MANGLKIYHVVMHQSPKFCIRKGSHAYVKHNCRRESQSLLAFRRACGRHRHCSPTSSWRRHSPSSRVLRDVAACHIGILACLCRGGDEAGELKHVLSGFSAFFKELSLPVAPRVRSSRAGYKESSDRRGCKTGTGGLQMRAERWKAPT